MTPKVALRIAAFLSLFTFVGHTAHHFVANPQNDPGIAAVEQSMSETTVPLPMGVTRSITNLVDGYDWNLSLYLLVTGIIFILFSNQPVTGSGRNVLLVSSLGIGIAALLAAKFFFPLPAICLGLACLFGLYAFRTSQA